MTKQQLETETACVETPPRCPNCGETVLREATGNFADRAIGRLQRLLQRVFDAQERSLKSLAYQIQDDFVQQLIGAALRLQAAERLQSSDPVRTARELRAVRKLLCHSVDKARSIASRLRPPALDDFGIVGVIDYLIAEVAQKGELEIEFSHNGEFARIPAPVEIAAFRIVRELLANASRHSQTRKVRVSLARVDGRLRVEVRDWGIGFDPAWVNDDSFGLEEIRERAELLGGRTAIDSAPGKGARVVVELPLGSDTLGEA